MSNVSVFVRLAFLNYKVVQFVLLFKIIKVRCLLSRLSGVVVSMLATEPKGSGFEPGQGDGFLRAIKIRNTPSSRMASKVGRSHVVRFYGM
jgi:hypothetical protein